MNPHIDFKDIKISPVLGMALEQYTFPQRMQVAMVIDTNIHEIERFLSEGGTMKEALLRIIGLIDEEMKNNVEWNTISCKAGCSHCCRINVDISEAEAEILVDYAEQENIEVNREALESQQHLSNGERSKSLFKDCVFLSKENTCKVYKVRPLNCRKYLVQTAPELCNTIKHKNAIVGINFEIQTEIIASSYNSLNPIDNMAKMLLLALNKRKTKNLDGIRRPTK